MTDPESEAIRKEMAEIIYRVNPFDVVGKEGRAIARVADVFSESQAPEFMLQSLMDELRHVARRKARSKKALPKDKEIWRNIHSFLKKPMTP